MIQYHPEGVEPFPFKDGQLLQFTRGGHRGKVVRVNTGYSFWGDAERWEVVLDLECDGEWLYFIRASLEEVRHWTEEID